MANEKRDIRKNGVSLVGKMQTRKLLRLLGSIAIWIAEFNPLFSAWLEEDL
jgi:hypothetical protein